MTDTPPWGGQDEPTAARPGYGLEPGPPDFAQPGQPTQPGYGQPGYGQPGQQGWGPVGAPSPGGVPLRPLGLGDILGGAFNLIRQNPVTTLGLTGIDLTITAVIWVIAGFISSRAGHSAYLLVAVLPSLLLLGVLVGGLTAAMGQGVLGLKMSIADAVRASRPQWVLLAFVLLWLIPVVVSIPLFLVLHGWAILVALPLLSWLGIMLILTIPAVVLERRGAISAMGRSWRLVRGSYWRVFGICVLTYFMLMLLSLIITVPLEIIGGLASLGTGSGAAGVSIALVVFVIGEIVIYTLTATIFAGVIVLIYADMRMRKEGMDLVLQQAAQSQRLRGDEFALSQYAMSGPHPLPGGYTGGTPGGYTGGTPGGG
jgi:hypothetical protein